VRPSQLARRSLDRDGFGSFWQTAKERAGIGRELHFHDLRGTATTMFATAGYRDLQIEGEGARIRRKDVNARNMAKGLQALLEGETRHAISAVAG
jgi:integrase